MNATFYELRKFDKSIDESKSVLDKFLYFSKNAEDMKPEELNKISKDLHVLSKAISIAKKSNWTEE